MFLFFIATNSFSQVSLEGIVKDSIGNPLELANVIAIDKSTNLLESYSITDQTGTYKLNLKQNTFYNLQVSYIGKKNLEFQIKTSESDETKNFSYEIKIKKNRLLFPLNFIDLNLKFKSFKFETSRILESIIINIKIL